MEHKSFSLSEFKALDEAGTFDAVVAVFDNVDHGGDRLRRTGFDRTLGGWREKGRGVPILWSHDAETVPIGVAPNLIPGRKNLVAREAKLFIEDNAHARAVWGAMKGGALYEFSFGYGVPEGGAEYVMENGRKVRDLNDVELYEISPVFRGMNPETQLLSVKSLSIDVKTLEFDDLKSLGSRIQTEIDERQEKALKAAAEPPLPIEPTNPPPEPAPISEVDPPPPTPTPVPYQEPNDNPEPNPADAGEEAKARIRALQAAKPEHLE
jgi:HK97 family phage prohead protease